MLTAIGTSRLRSSGAHCHPEFAKRGKGGGGGGRGGGGREGRKTRRRSSSDKSNNPHLAGGEKRMPMMNISSFMVWGAPFMY